MGSLGVLLITFKKKLISEQETRFIVQEMVEKNFRVSAEVINKFWILFNELKKSNYFAP